MKNTVPLGKMLRKYRIDNDLSAKSMAQALGFSLAYLNSVELGRKLPSNEMLINLASIYGFDLEQLIQLAMQQEPSKHRKTISIEGLNAAQQIQVAQLIKQLRASNETH